MRAIIALAMLALASSAAADPVTLTGSLVPEPVTLAVFLALPRPAPDASLSYGPADTQGIDVYLPKTGGPHPVLVFIHGGCWDKDIPGREHVRALGPDLARRGIAMWSIGYRRANEAGGGYPGTYQDVATAIDRLRAEAGRFNLDLTRTAIAGHSAGGHLALWAAGRGQLAKASPLHAADPFVPGAAIGLAAIGHMEKAARYFPVSCGPGLREAMLGQPSPTRPDVHADTAPERLLPSPPAKLLVSGIYDAIVPPYAAFDYAQAARKAGQDPVLVNLPDSAHFDMVTPGTPAWAEVVRRIEAALAR